LLSSHLLLWHHRSQADYVPLVGSLIVCQLEAPVVVGGDTEMKARRASPRVFDGPDHVTAASEIETDRPFC
jgi:hypothetical protein